MADRNGEPNTPKYRAKNQTFPLSRRGWLSLAGVGLIGGSAVIGSAEADSHILGNVVTFDGTGAQERSTYEFTVSGSIEPDGSVGAIEVSDTIDGSSVTGSVHRDIDSYRFSGQLESLNVQGQASVTIEYAGQTSSEADRLEIMTPVNEDVSYAFSSTDRIVKVLDNGDASAEEENDTVVENGDGTWAVEGFTGNGYGDTYDFWGDVSSFTASGTFTLFLNGEEISIAELTGQDPVDEGDDPTNEPPTHELEIVSGAPDFDYSFTASGEIYKLLDNGDNSAEEGNDTVIENDDGTWTVEGFTGNGYGDGYGFHGEILSFEPVSGEFTLYLDGEEISVHELTGEEVPAHRLEVVSGAPDFDYSFTASGEITKLLDNGDNSAEEDNDDVIENDDGTWTVEGFTGNGYGDGYGFHGEILSFEPLEGEFILYIDGDQISAYELVGEEPPDEDPPVDGGPVGGGNGYDRTVNRDDADAVVSSRNGLADALSSASSGDIIYVAGNATIDMGSETLNVPAGVTLASNRGIDDAPGGHLYTDAEVDIFHLGRDSRLTGLRIQGPYFEYFDPDHYATGDAVETKGRNVEIDNCEIWGFAHASIGLEADAGHVHHNHIHHNSRDGLGYGVVNESSGHQLIEWNHFNYNRHSIASGGNGGYTVRNNHFGPDTIDHVIDVHRPGGDLTEVYNNTVEASHSLVDGQRDPAVAIRGVPDEVADIHHNWFFNSAEPRDDPSGWTTECIIQVHVDEWTNVQWSNNHLGETEPPSSDIGCPR